MKGPLTEATVAALQPKRPPQQVRLSISIPADLAEFARDAAAQADVPLSRFIAYCLEQHRASEQ